MALEVREIGYLGRILWVGDCDAGQIVFEDVLDLFLETAITIRRHGEDVRSV